MKTILGHLFFLLIALLILGATLKLYLDSEKNVQNGIETTATVVNFKRKFKKDTQKNHRTGKERTVTHKQFIPTISYTTTRGEEIMADGNIYGFTSADKAPEIGQVIPIIYNIDKPQNFVVNTWIHLKGAYLISAIFGLLLLIFASVRKESINKFRGFVAALAILVVLAIVSIVSSLAVGFYLINYFYQPDLNITANYLITVLTVSFPILSLVINCLIFIPCGLVLYLLLDNVLLKTKKTIAGLAVGSTFAHLFYHLFVSTKFAIKNDFNLPIYINVIMLIIFSVLMYKFGWRLERYDN